MSIRRALGDTGARAVSVRRCIRGGMYVYEATHSELGCTLLIIGNGTLVRRMPARSE